MTTIVSDQERPLIWFGKEGNVTDVVEPRTEAGAPFTIDEIRRFAGEVSDRQQERAERLATEAGRQLIWASRTVTAADGYVLTITDGDVLDAILAIEAEAATLALADVAEKVRGHLERLTTYPGVTYQWPWETVKGGPMMEQRVAVDRDEAFAVLALLKESR